MSAGSTPATTSGRRRSPRPARSAPGVTIVSGWASAGNPALVAQGTALTAFWPGSPTLETGNPQAGINLATSGGGGRSWSVSPRAVTTDGFASQPAAAVPGGTFLQAFLRGSE